ncbi:Glycosyl-phosphatidyl inositol-anchored, plant [Corchorus capsularis]|uniref:Glycosyl-phosphatidyl inositol-anchored, plant n=1 Tax=Corchorus capsularis TaxID=210143 RepID=A0A1R3I2A9_COCAP|nr:Glycosyl-phosphatidyl inositol-anchored, plant [Corchorus capsularis]
MKLSWKVMFFLFYSTNHFCLAQDYDDDTVTQEQPILPKGLENCNGIFLSYNFISRTKEYPHVKNATAQAWAFKSTVTVMNTGTYVLPAWKMFIGFQNREILVSAGGAVLTTGQDFPSPVGNGTYLSGYPQTDLETSINTAGDLSQIQAKVELSGTQFGLMPNRIPMPKTIKLVNDGYKCPKPIHQQTSMYVCCVKDPKFKAKELKSKFLPRQKGDLSISYDVTQAYGNNYMAQVTIQNSNPLGRLDHWNLTWEWMRGEFIYSMKGAYVRDVDHGGCLYGLAGQYYKEMDFSQVLNCQKKPIIFDLPAEKANDTQLGKIPFCCKNGTVLPETMDGSKSKSVFQVQVFKIPPDLNRTAIYPPQKWKIEGVLNPDYKCGAPIRVDPTQTPDSNGLQATKYAIASWQIVCNISRPTQGKFKCCVTFSAYYNKSVIPCDTCACGCPNTAKCNPDKKAMLLPPEALLLPFENRSTKARAWAYINHFPLPKPLPCSDNCGVTINWHVVSDYTNGWAARITLFNWKRVDFEDWFTAVQLKKHASRGFEKLYSFNGTLLKKVNNTIFIQGLPGLNYLIGKMNGTNPKTDPDVPGKQQSVISFKKKPSQGIDIAKGDGFPSRVFFNGKECALPTRIPIGNGGNRRSVNFVLLFLFTIAGFLLIEFSFVS